MEDKKVKDVMLPLSEYATISKESTIQQALMELNKAQLGLTYDRHHHRAILVLDEKGHVVGKLSHWAMLRILEPRFINDNDMDSLARAGLSSDFIHSMKESFRLFQGGLSRMCQRVAHLKVEAAMVPVHDCIDEKAQLTEAIHVLVMSHAQSMLVSRNGHVVGVLRLSDVFEEVADMIRHLDNKE